ncbi:MAG TPA: sn-glycerol-3-phosphate ABC transporter ATP-binding protein UgpC [Intrasporangium sp.]|nr:sn-glycerol-3-phosphate ABC transporter ATP-binding protein UgpC [Intrasporangium sp.]
MDGVGKVYADGTRAVTDLNLAIAEGEFLVLVGPSGCGKTTALRMVAGLEDISEGTITIGERVVNRVPSRDRDVAMVFQSYALYPHLTVRDNIAFGLQLRKMPKDEINRRVQRAAEILGLTDHLDRKPRNLSGGQRQRVAMGRAIVREPQAFLMDEPLSNLDAKLRVQMRAEIARLQRDLGVTTIYVTHDQTEAMTLGDRVAVMSKGVLQQVDHPQSLYDHPANLFVAGFIGSPAMNLMRGRLERDGGLAVVLGDQRLEVPDAALSEHPGLEDHIGSEVVVGIRPEDMDDADLSGESHNVLASKAELVEAMGSDVMIHFTVNARRVTPGDSPDVELEMEAAPGLVGGDGDRTIVIARCNPRTKAQVGEPVRIAVDTSRLHYFDPGTGEAIGFRSPELTETDTRREA